MLIEFSVTNYRSFAERVTLSMEASSDKTHLGNIIGQDLMGGRRDTHLLKSALVFGGNASGKSNVVCAFHAFQQTVLKTGDKNAFPWVDSFRLDQDLRSQPTTFEAKLLFDGTIYTYTVTVDSQRVREERLIRQRWRGKEVELFHRPFDERVSGTRFCGEISVSNQERLREFAENEGACLLGGAKGERFKELEAVRDWFENGLLIVDMATPPAELVKSIVERCKSDETRQWVAEAVRTADPGIEGLRVGKVAVQVASGEIQELEIVYTQRRDRQGNRVEFSFFEESTGTQRLLSLLAPIIDALRNRSLVVFDELEASLHPRLTRELLGVMNDAEANERGAQFVVASHDTNLLDRDLMRRDQLWLVEKSDPGVTELFSWHDVGWEDRPRKEAPFEKVYLSGKLGGVPVLSGLKFALTKAVFDDSDSPLPLKLSPYDLSTQLSRIFDSPAKWMIVKTDQEQEGHSLEAEIRRFDLSLADPSIDSETRVSKLVGKAFYLDALERSDEAIQCLDEAISIADVSSDLKAVIYCLKAVPLLVNEKLDAVVECLKEALVLPDISLSTWVATLTYGGTLLRRIDNYKPLAFYDNVLETLILSAEQRAWVELRIVEALMTLERHQDAQRLLESIFAMPSLPTSLNKEAKSLKSKIKKALQSQ